MIEGHGDDLWRYAGKIRHNFSTNIHSAFDHGPLMEMLARSGYAVASYPEPAPVSVERAVADMVGCMPDEVMAANGATEAIYLIAIEFAGKNSAILAPTFREYQDSCRMHSHKISFIDSLEVLSESGKGGVTERFDTVWLCNPNNPTGQVIPRERLLEVIAANPETVFVIDQAYSDYTLLPVLTARDAVEAGNVVLLGSLTKRFAVPGLRIGYAVGASVLLDRFSRWRMPWSVNGPAIAGALYLLARRSEYLIEASGLHAEALRISEEFRKMGIDVTPTDCNFILCRLPDVNGKEVHMTDLKEYLIEEAGILIRDASNFEGLDGRYFRIAAQSPEENDLLISKVREYLNKKGASEL